MLVHGFCPMKITITQFPGGFRLNSPSRKTTYADFRLQLFPGRKVKGTCDDNP